jgi:hypothetical protein
MRKSQLEAWVLSVIARVEAGQPNEDARVELKSEWPNPKKAARRIAGHANSAGGDIILWIIGVDQETGVIGAVGADLATWLPQMRAEFNELAPNLLLDLNIQYRDRTLVALLFETDRAPFVVRNPAFGTSGGGPVELEVPWREGTRIRSATRSDLLRLLSPLEELPSFEVIEGSLKMEIPQDDVPKKPSWHVRLRLYVVPKVTPIVLPFHKSKGAIRVGNQGIGVDLNELLLYPANKLFGVFDSTRENSNPTMIQDFPDELVISGPGMIKIQASAKSLDALDTPPLDDARVTFDIQPANSIRPCKVFADFKFLKHNGKEYEWFLMVGAA